MENLFIHNDDYTQSPFDMFTNWFDEAKNSESVKDATAFAMATSSKGGRPSVRMVLMKLFDAQGITFFTNESSQKGRCLTQNPQAEACFYWDSLGRQIRIYGKVEKVPDEESDQYFASRHINSQRAACISKQSSELKHYSLLKEEYIKHAQESHQPVRPLHWCGFRIKPLEFEFWVDGPHRLHLRHKYNLIDNSWQHKFLYP